MFRNPRSHSSFKVGPKFHPLYLISRWFYGHIVGFVLNDETHGRREGEDRLGILVGLGDKEMPDSFVFQEEGEAKCHQAGLHGLDHS
jgi:hypothetical protein